MCLGGKAAKAHSKKKPLRGTMPRNLCGHDGRIH